MFRCEADFEFYLDMGIAMARELAKLNSIGSNLLACQLSIKKKSRSGSSGGGSSESSSVARPVNHRKITFC